MSEEIKITEQHRQEIKRLGILHRARVFKRIQRIESEKLIQDMIVGVLAMALIIVASME